MSAVKPESATDTLLEVQDLRVHFEREGTIRAVDGVNLKVAPKEIMGLVGESGSGKTVLALSLLGLIAPGGKAATGQINWQGNNILELSEAGLREIRGQQIAMIFQNPQASLNPARTIGAQMEAVIRLHRKMNASEAKEEARRMIEAVHLSDAERVLKGYSHQFSGGMCQRIMIAMALACRPKLLIADEPTAALDVTIAAQIMDLLLEVREKFGMAILLVSHDLGVIARMCDRIAVMYLGRIVETASAVELYKNPKHPYTQALLKSVPVPDPSRKNERHVLEGEVPSNRQNFSGSCRFRSRCPQAEPRCAKVEPPFCEMGPGHGVACILYEK